MMSCAHWSPAARTRRPPSLLPVSSRGRVSTGAIAGSPLASSLPAVVVGLAAAYVLVVLALGLEVGNINTGDSNLLAAGARASLDCLRDGVLSSCGTTGTFTTVGPYPLLQYLPAVAGTLAGLSADHVVVLMASVSLLSFAACLVLPVLALDAVRRPEQRARAAVAVCAVLVSTAPYQATSGFGEMLAAAAVAAAVTSAARRWLAAVGPTTLLACLGKETLAPVVVVLCLAAASKGRLVPDRAAALRVGAGAVAAVLLSVAFNVFRFGSPGNASYLLPEFRTARSSLLPYALGQWLSPSAGVAVFWPVATAVLVVGLVVGLAGMPRTTKAEARAAWALLCCLAAVGSTTALAAWYSPFGWISFGPRLAVPVLPGAVLAVLVVLPPLARDPRRLPLAVRSALVAVVAGLGWVGAGTPWSAEAAVQELIAPVAGCPPLTMMPIQEDVERYYRCTEAVMARADGGVYGAAATEGGGRAVPGRITGTLLAAGLGALALSRPVPPHAR